MAKRIGAHVGDENTVLVTNPPKVEQCTNGGRTLAGLTEGRKVMQAREAARRSIHCRQIEVTGVPQGVRATTRITRAHDVGYAVFVTAPHRRKARVKAFGGHRHAGDEQVWRATPDDAVEASGKGLFGGTTTPRCAERAPPRGTHIDVGNLTGGVNSRICATGDDESHIALRVSHQYRKRFFNDGLYGAQSGLTAPPRERCSVVGQVEPQPHSLHSARVYGAQFDDQARASDARATMSAISVNTPLSNRLPGLDGLRALAIVLVLAYHLFPRLAPGGFIGVDVFLVVSGYLITALLIAEHRTHGRLRLRRFWGRRARRLLPALLVVMGVTSGVAVLIGGDVLVGIGWQLAGALTFSSNWVSIAQGSSYLDQTSPELFRHAWSLAVEEQFYLLWPLLLVALLLVPARAVRVVLPLTFAVGSAIALAVFAGDPLQNPGAASAAYLSTLTHGFGLLLGAALALGLEPLQRQQSAPRTPGWAADAGALLSASGLLALSLVLSIDTAATYRGGLVAAALLTGVFIVCVSHPAGRAAAIADAPLPRWIGERSYGLYLWHWPVLILFGAALPIIDRVGDQSWMLGLGALTITVPLAAVSYRWVEQPIRTRRVDAIVRGSAGWSTPRRGAFAAAGVLALLGTVAAGIVAVVRAPVQSEAAALIAAGQAAIDDQVATVPLRVPLLERGPAPPVPSTLPTGDQLYAVGDSVMLAAAPQLQSRFPGIAIDAAVSRQMRQAPEIVRALADSGQLRDVMVVGLGTNGSIDPATLLELRSIIGPDRWLVLVSAQAPRGWIAEVNVHLGQFADDYREVVVADWRAAISPQLNVLARDQVHPGSAGGQIYTDTVEGALQYLADLPDPVDYEANPELQRPQ